MCGALDSLTHLASNGDDTLGVLDEGDGASEVLAAEDGDGGLGVSVGGGGGVGIKTTIPVTGRRH